MRFEGDTRGGEPHDDHEHGGSAEPEVTRPFERADVRRELGPVAAPADGDLPAVRAGAGERPQEFVRPVRPGAGAAPGGSGGEQTRVFSRGDSYSRDDGARDDSVWAPDPEDRDSRSPRGGRDAFAADLAEEQAWAPRDQDRDRDWDRRDDDIDSTRTMTRPSPSERGSRDHSRADRYDEPPPPSDRYPDDDDDEPPRRGRRPRPARRRRFRFRHAVGIVVLLAVLTPFATWAWVWYTARVDDRTRSDAILVLGASQYNGRPSPIFEARLQHAANLYEQGVAPAIVTVGGNQPGDNFTEGGSGAAWLAAQGIPSERLVAVEKGNDTLQSFEAVAPVFAERGWDSAVIVTDPWHSLRSREMAGDHGITSAVTSPSRSGPAVLKRETQLWYITRETASLWYYWIFGDSTDIEVDATR